VDVVATAKKDLAAGEIIDCLGGFMTYGQCETYDISLKEKLLPIGLAEGCKLKRPVKKDAVLTYDDIELPTHKLSYQLRMEQDALFGNR
jgi:predicted homoserine dehydrogenase-like protein